MHIYLATFCIFLFPTDVFKLVFYLFQQNHHSFYCLPLKSFWVCCLLKSCFCIFLVFFVWGTLLCKSFVEIIWGPQMKMITSRENFCLLLLSFWGTSTLNQVESWDAIKSQASIFFWADSCPSWMCSLWRRAPGLSKEGSSTRSPFCAYHCCPKGHQSKASSLPRLRKESKAFLCPFSFCDHIPPSTSLLLLLLTF